MTSPELVTWAKQQIQLGHSLHDIELSLKEHGHDQTVINATIDAAAKDAPHLKVKDGMHHKHAHWLMIAVMVFLALLIVGGYFAYKHFVVSPNEIADPFAGFMFMIPGLFRKN